MLNAEQFKKIYPQCPDAKGWVNAMISLFPRYGIKTNRRIAAFISQCGHESAGWSTFSENLNYSEKALNSVFPKYFINAGRNAKDFAHKPEKIANIVYANRMGNGDIESGDGWKYRGRGPIQLTGKENYEKFSITVGLNVIDYPNLVSEKPNVGLMSALWYWDSGNLNSYADKEDLRGLTKAINGGYTGLEDRIKQYWNIMNVLEISVESGTENNKDFTPFKLGSKGTSVKIIQEILGIQADGIFGPDTESAVKKWQKESHLEPDGIVGPITLDLMLNNK